MLYNDNGCRPSTTPTGELSGNARVQPAHPNDTLDEHHDQTQRIRQSLEIHEIRVSCSHHQPHVPGNKEHYTHPRESGEYDKHAFGSYCGQEAVKVGGEQREEKGGICHGGVGLEDTDEPVRDHKHEERVFMKAQQQWQRVHADVRLEDVDKEKIEAGKELIEKVPVQTYVGREFTYEDRKPIAMAEKVPAAAHRRIGDKVEHTKPPGECKEGRHDLEEKGGAAGERNNLP